MAKSKFKDRLALLIKQKGVGKIKLEKATGMYNGQAGILLSGKTEPTLRTLQKLVKYFKGVNVEWLVTGKGNP